VFESSSPGTNSDAQGFTSETSSDIGSSEASSNVSDVVSSEEQKPDKKAVDWERVLNTTVNELKATLPELKFIDGLSSVHKEQIHIDANLEEQDIINELHDSILDLVEYDLYIEYKDNPQNAQPVIIDHNYFLKYKGLSDGGSEYVIEIYAEMNEQKYIDEVFDSDEVIAKATAKLLDSTEEQLKGMQVMTDRDYTESRIIEGIQTFEQTEQAADTLSRYAENEIVSVLLGAKNYTQFKIEFYAKGDTAYTFILYLK
jgi:hypothetical protein